ncbi:hypothetical protein [Pseudarthrobacter sp. WHRI 8279]|uniref:hypothetical protein n=1 Tax=Pseudarthrobacter sp. WHRI 8279 TaxID=3162566 RepID=UPI0035A82A3A
MAGNPFRALCFERLDLVLGGAVEFLTRDVLIDLRRPLPVRTVRAAEVTDVGFANGAVFLPVPAEGTGTCVPAARATIEIAGCTVLAVTTAGPLAAFSEGPPVFSTTETAAVPFAITARTITKRLLVPITIGLTIAITERLPLTTTTERLTVTVAEWLPLTTTETAAVALAITARTITKGLLVPITIGLTIAITERLPLTTTTERLTVTVTERLPVAVAETAAVALAITARTITKGLLVPITIGLTIAITERLPLTVTERLPLTTAGGTT